MMHIAPMIDMAQSKEEIEEAMPKAVAESDKAGPIYSYGLCLHLTEKELEKLNLDTDVEPGDMIHIIAMAKVTNVGMRADENGGTSSVDLQITHMAVENEDEEGEEMDAEEQVAHQKAKEGRWYGSKEA